MSRLSPNSVCGPQPSLARQIKRFLRTAQENFVLDRAFALIEATRRRICRNSLSPNFELRLNRDLDSVGPDNTLFRVVRDLPRDLNIVPSRATEVAGSTNRDGFLAALAGA